MCARVGGCAAASGRLKHVAEFFTNGLNIVAALHSDPSDPDVIIKLDISNAFNVLCRQPTLDVLGGKDSRDYTCGLKEGDNIETVCEKLRHMFQYFRAMRTTKSHLRQDSFFHVRRT